jgi:hypothetical protein
VLGGAGVAVSAQYAVSKLYNDPLLRTSISLVASQDGKNRGTERDQDQTKELSIAVSSALLLAFCVGFIQLIIYSLLGNSIIRGMKSLWGSVHLSASCDCLNGLNSPPPIRNRHGIVPSVSHVAIGSELFEGSGAWYTSGNTLARDEWNLSWSWRYSDATGL